MQQQVSEGKRLCLVTTMIAHAAMGKDSVEDTGGVIIPEEDDDLIDLSIKMDEVMNIPPYRFNRQGILFLTLNVMMSAIADAEEDGDKNVEQRVIADLDNFFDLELAEAKQRSVAA